MIAKIIALTRYGAALAFLVGESPDTCLEDPTCDQEVFPFWQVRPRALLLIFDELCSSYRSPVAFMKIDIRKKNCPKATVESIAVIQNFTYFF